jgi:hypothetical protein
VINKLGLTRVDDRQGDAFLISENADAMDDGVVRPVNCYPRTITVPDRTNSVTKSRTYLAKKAQRDIALGVSVADACARQGLSVSLYNSLINRSDAMQDAHRNAMDARAHKVEDALYRMAVGESVDVIEQRDEQGNVISSQVRKCGGDVKAACAWLKARKPTQFGDAVTVNEPNAIQSAVDAVLSEVTDGK